MFKWILRIVFIGLIGSVGVEVYQSYQGGYFNLPDMPKGSYAFSMRNGFRGIVLNASVSNEISADIPKYFRRLSFANTDRRYISLPAAVPAWMTTAWSTCSAPTEAERDEVLGSLAGDAKLYVTGARFEAICRVDLDGSAVVRGLLFSVPRM